MKNLQTIKHNAQKGFTLIELMIVVAIIGILAALAIPAYQDYTIKSRVGEGASLSGAFKTAIEIYWSENGTLDGITAPLGGSSLNLTAVQAEYVSSIVIRTNSNRPELDVQLRTGTNKLGSVQPTGADGGCFTYIPLPSGGAGSNLEWSVEAGQNTNCTNGIATKYLPKT